jgi:uncharacterized protein (TIGR03435 family)
MCGFGELTDGGGMIRRGSGTVRQLVEDLNNATNIGGMVSLPGRQERVIVDGTGLEGFFVWDYEYGFRVGSVKDVVPGQLGLKLEPARLPMDVVVIDDVRMPTPN